jgi:hypothetical protein
VEREREPVTPVDRQQLLVGAARGTRGDHRRNGRRRIEGNFARSRRPTSALRTPTRRSRAPPIEHSREAELQVEIARLKYVSPRLREHHLSHNYPEPERLPPDEGGLLGAGGAIIYMVYWKGLREIAEERGETLTHLIAPHPGTTSGDKASRTGWDGAILGDTILGDTISYRNSRERLLWRRSRNGRS